MDRILYWNDVALEANRRDFSNVAGTAQPMPEQGGPTLSSRALAIVHLAITPKDGISDLCDPQWLPLSVPNSSSHVPLGRTAHIDIHGVQRGVQGRRSIPPGLRRTLCATRR